MRRPRRTQPREPSARLKDVPTSMRTTFLAPFAGQTSRRGRWTIVRPSPPDRFDPAFYRSYYSDLADLSPTALHRHLKRHGLKEGRSPNSQRLLERLQAEHGLLPSDFKPEMYREANPELRDRLTHTWQAAAHYLIAGQYRGLRADEALQVAAPAQGPESSTEGLSRPATAEDIRICFELFHGRAAEAQVVLDRTGQPLGHILVGALGSEEFETMVVRPLTKNRPPHATLNLPLSIDDGAAFFRDLGLDPAKLRKAQGPAEILRVLHAAPSVRAVLQAHYAPGQLADFEAGLDEVCEAPESERPPQDEAPLTVVRADMLRLEKALAPMFGPERLKPALVSQIARAMRQVEGSGAVLADQVGPVLIARYMLARSSRQRLNYGRTSTQVAVVAETCFGQEGDLDRTALETRILNRVRRAAIATPLCAPVEGAPPFSAAMACAAHLRHGAFKPARSDEEAVAALYEFYDETLFRCGFERYLTPEQRAFLGARRATISAGGDAASDVAPLSSFAALDGAALQALQVQAFDPGSTPHLSVPTFLAEPEAPAVWLAKAIRDGLEGEPLDQRGLAPSALSYAAGHAFSPPRPAPHQPGRGRKLVRPGDRVTFNEAGEGRRHLIGNGWWQGEATHTWSGRHAALLAFHLAAEDVGPLDLHLRLLTGPRVGGVVNLYWNGALVGRLRPAPSCVQLAQVHLGLEHRAGLAANILCLEVDQLFTPLADPRRLGVALCDLTFVPR